jgi:very-short-patch-repair endonuclease
MAGRCGWHHSRDAREKIRIANTGKNNSYRGENISKARSQRPFSESEWSMMIAVHNKYPWVLNPYDFINLTKIEDLFGKVKKARRSEIFNRILKTEGNKRYLPRCIQGWSIDKIEQFKTDVNMIGYTKYDSSDYFKSRYGLSQKTYCHAVKIILGVSTTVFPRTSRPHKKQTSVEAFVQKVFDDFNILYQAEKYVCNNHWRVDFMLDGNKAVEVYGTYHHADPRIFRNIDLDTIQKNNVQRDTERCDWLLKNNFELLIVWQKDIQERPEWVTRELINYAGVNNDGITKNYDGRIFQGSLWN